MRIPLEFADTRTSRRSYKTAVVLGLATVLTAGCTTEVAGHGQGPTRAPMDFFARQLCDELTEQVRDQPAESTGVGLLRAPAPNNRFEIDYQFSDNVRRSVTNPIYEMFGDAYYLAGWLGGRATGEACVAGPATFQSDVRSAIAQDPHVTPNSYPQVGKDGLLQENSEDIAVVQPDCQEPTCV